MPEINPTPVPEMEVLEPLSVPKEAELFPLLVLDQLLNFWLSSILTINTIMLPKNPIFLFIKKKNLSPSSYSLVLAFMPGNKS